MFGGFASPTAGGFGAPAGVFGAPAPAAFGGFGGAPAASPFGAPAPAGGFGAPAPAFGAAAPAFGAPAPAFNIRGAAASAPSAPAFAAPAPTAAPAFSFGSSAAWVLDDAFKDPAKAASSSITSEIPSLTSEGPPRTVTFDEGESEMTPVQKQLLMIYEHYMPQRKSTALELIKRDAIKVPKMVNKLAKCLVKLAKDYQKFPIAGRCDMRKDDVGIILEKRPHNGTQIIISVEVIKGLNVGSRQWYEAKAMVPAWIPPLPPPVPGKAAPKLLKMLSLEIDSTDTSLEKQGVLTDRGQE